MSIDEKTRFDSFLGSLGEGIFADTRPETLSNYSSDVFFETNRPPIAVLKPSSVSDVQTIWRVASRHHVSVITRGAGLSYSGGVAPQKSNTVIIDTRSLQSIERPDITDRVISVDAGATWQSIDDALAGSGFRTALTPPISGSLSTVGGALAQGLPTGLDSVLGLDVVTPDGALHLIGPHHFGSRQRGAEGTMGLDARGLFLRTGGVMGSIVRAHIRLEPVPRTTDYRSFSVQDVNKAAALIVAFSRVPGSLRFVAMPSRREQDAQNLPLKEKLRAGLSILTSANSAREVTWRAASMLRAMTPKADASTAKANVHAIIEANSSGEARRIGHQLDRIADETKARKIHSSAAVALGSRLYSLRGMLGPKGERWVPVHGLGAISQLPTYAAATNDFCDENEERLSESSISVTWLMMAWSGRCALVEPMFLWPAPLLPIHAHAGYVTKTIDTTWTDRALARTELVSKARKDLASRFDELGALHVQMGALYPYRTRLSPPFDNLVKHLKRTIDPSGVAAPGVLGFVK